ncbi:MAG: hypothetical protein COT91_03785 [Candidatus Doudnabacteria bacterium CG10_big_fil_rev_8_21_14_0_10_41_10]|uniref:DUF4342 domain-containing protein n=1 Tax=Candidatus Doudnabacteria bacterium CG10_big_fil_rev_8_21_14_0_10_41_10 TaxID=1974551 RepID=A0A2H0VD37_9BACT|nr:MAG: hypothetical protein COT91_03785 [Candidatus Doudnabacteria bacterium CG10_big_fil_rev_8_21_14_0_10_41_10]
MKKKEEFKVSGKELKEKVKHLIKEGNVRRIIIKNSEGNDLMEIPVNFAVVGAVLAPMLAAVGAIAAFLTDCTVVVERKK